jgi:hypothetical protein
VLELLWIGMTANRKSCIHFSESFPCGSSVISFEPFTECTGKGIHGLTSGNVHMWPFVSLLWTNIAKARNCAATFTGHSLSEV